MNIDDIRRLNYIKYTDGRVLVHAPHSLLRCFIIHIFKIIYQFFKWRVGTNIVNEILFIMPSINNAKSLIPIKNFLPDNKCSVWNDLARELPNIRIYVRSLLFIPLILKLYFNSSDEDRRLIRYYFKFFILACPAYIELERLILRYNNLKMIILSNDHNLISRILIELAEKHKIKTLYVQHASITEGFPPLRFDYSFLDGKESFIKYMKIGNNRGYSFLTGSPRFDYFRNYRHLNGEKKYDVGVALNELDSEEMVLQLCQYLKKYYSTKIIVRPHPGMLSPSNLLFHENHFKECGFSISDPKKDLSFVFLSNIKVMVANESGIHLDAALMGVPSLLYNFSNNEVMDWYSYLKNGMIKQCNTFQEVVKMLDSGYQLPVDKVRFFSASFKTAHDGKVGEFIAQFIRKVVFESEESALKFIESQMIMRTDYAEYRN